MTAKTAQRNDIQGLRALAVLAVIAFHVDRNLLPAGFIGVDIFLVISGYLITDIILRQQQLGNFSLLKFYAARIRRIVPAYLAVLLGTALAMAVLLIPDDFSRFKSSLLSALYFNSNNYFAHQGDYFAPETHELPLLHTWSLAVEMQFYLVFPFLLKLTNRRFLPTILLAGIITFGLYSIFRSEVDEDWTYYSLSLRIPEFLTGSYVAARNIGMSWQTHTRNGVAWFGMLLVLTSSTAITAVARHYPPLLLLACIGTAMLISARTSALNALISSPPLAKIGNLSYSLYLWHWPILAAMRYYNEGYELSGGAILTALCLTAALAHLSYRFIETPFRQQAPKQKLIIHCGLLLAAIPLGVAAATRLNLQLDKPLPPILTRYAPKNSICHGTMLADCTQGARTGQVHILMLGDSHAAHLTKFADTLGLALGIRFDVISSMGCIPIKDFDTQRIAAYARKPCQLQTGEILNRVHMRNGIILAGRWSAHVQSNHFMQALANFLEETRNLQKPVLVLAQVPELKGNIHRNLRFRNFGFYRPVKAREDWQTANRLIGSLVSNYSHATFLDLSMLPIFATAPYYEGQPIYFDSHHLNEFGSAKYGEAAIPYIKKWIKEDF